MAEPTKRKRVLFISPLSSALVPFSGYQYRVFHILKHLAVRHEVDLITCGPRAPHPEPCLLDLTLLRRFKVVPEAVRGPLAGVVAIFRSGPYHAQIFSSNEMRQAISDWLSQYHYDCVFLCKSDLMGLFLGNQKRGAPAIVIDQIASEPDTWENLIRNHPKWYYRVYAQLNYHKVLRFIRRAYDRAAAVICITERDANITRQQHPHARVVVVPSGVDPAAYVPRDDPDYTPQTLLFSGTGAARNVDAMRWYLESVHAHVKAECPEIKVLWIGNVERSKIPFVKKCPELKLTGFVEDPVPCFNKGAIFIAPFRMGEGMKTKIVEAMAMGKVIVSTSMGVQGIDVAGLPFVRVADTPEAFAQELLQFLKNPPKTEKLGACARAYALERYPWDVVLTPLDELLDDVCSHG